MAKLEIIPLAPEDREVIDRVSAQVDERMATPSSPDLLRGPPPAGIRTASVEAANEKNDIRAALVDIERLALLSYVGVSLLIDRFGVTDSDFAAAIKSTVEYFRAQTVKLAPPSSGSASTPTPTEKENV